MELGCAVLAQWIESARERYVRRTEELYLTTSALDAGEVAAFVLLTPRQPYERAVSAWREWRRTRATHPEAPGMGCNRGKYIDALSTTYPYRRLPQEEPSAWALRLERDVRGLGPAKAPFLCSLLEPTRRDVPVCIDIWMLRGLGWPEEDAAQQKVGRVRAAQEIVRFMAERAGMGTFAWQWAAWDYWRSAEDVRQGVLVVRETEIGRDLA